MAAAAASLRRVAAAAAAPRRRSMTAQASLLLDMPPEIRREISRVKMADISDHRQLAQEVSRLSGVIINHEAAARLKPVEAAMHVGTLSWRVCTSVLTVSMAATFGVVQIAMPGWKSRYEDAAVKHASNIIKKKAQQLEESLAKKLRNKKTLVELGKNSITTREEKVAAKEAQLAVWEADIVKRETGM
ncbi:hypothetical protein VPH35_130851 [Triticum aestivum]